MDSSETSYEPTEKCLQVDSTKVEFIEENKDNNKLPAIQENIDVTNQAKSPERNLKSTCTSDQNVTNPPSMHCDKIEQDDTKTNKEPDTTTSTQKSSSHKSLPEKEKTKEEQKSQKDSVISTESHIPDENGIKDQKEALLNESAQKGGYNLKRKHRNTSAHDANPVSEENGTRTKRKKLKAMTDRFCWRCHKESVEAHCSACPRSWHRKCMGGTPPLSVDNWICGECAAILRAENAETRSTAMAQLSVDQLCMLLKHVVQRMRDYPGSEPFWKPVETVEAPNYLEYVVKPMDLSLLESNVRAKLYGSTDAFMADAKWIQHNCIVFNTCGGVYTDTSKLTNAAKQMIKLARQEVSEIEACPDCYAHGRNLPRPQPSWFIEPCSRPHPLVWAKLKGFPFWPAKAMPRVNSQGYVDVRFFGEHDRAWVAPRDLYLYSQDPPTPLPRKRKMDMDECVREITRHCRKLELVFGQFKFAPPKVQYNPHDPSQIKLMLPNYDPLQPNNFFPSPFSTAKKRVFLRKRGPSLGKNKTQNDALLNAAADILDTNASADSVSVGSEKKTKVNNTLTKANKGDNAVLMSKSLTAVISEGKERANDHIITLVENEEVDKSKIITEKLTGGKTTQNVSKSEMSKPDGALKEKDKADTTTMKHIQEIAANKSIIGSSATEKASSILISDKNLHEQGNSSHNTDSNRKTNVHLSATESTHKVGPKSTKSNMAKVYKPKTRMVDKVNAEEALKSVSDTKSKEKSSLLSADKISVKVESSLIDSPKSSNRVLKPPPLLLPSEKMDAHDDGRSISGKSSIKHLTADESGTLLLVVNNDKDDISKPSALVDNQAGGNILAVMNQEPKDQPIVSSLQKKESRARKSLPNKPPNHPQYTFNASKESITSSNDSILYIPATQKENCLSYQMVPPEAGPLSARLYSGAQELARKMAQLMEEAYKEAAQQNTDDEMPITRDKHRATVHFLRLQIERMRWQHQQQVAELKHNTDRILREMRASLEAERLRAMEETRRVAEEEKIRSIEETKRKQWCAMCGREALFYCCWNTAYCDYPCQQSHWPVHMKTCAQQPSLTATVVSPSSLSTSHQQSHQDQQHQQKLLSQSQQQQQQPQQQVMPRLVIKAQHAPTNLWTA